MTVLRQVHEHGPTGQKFRGLLARTRRVELHEMLNPGTFRHVSDGSPLIARDLMPHEFDAEVRGFTPIAVGIASNLGVDPTAFVFAVVFGANCSFATPIGYQTNLLVMGPGHYRFADYARAGLPLTILIWLTFSLFAPWYYQLM